MGKVREILSEFGNSGAGCSKCEGSFCVDAKYDECISSLRTLIEGAKPPNNEYWADRYRDGYNQALADYSANIERIFGGG